MNDNRIKGIIFVLAASLCYGVMPAVTQLSYKTGLSLETMLFSRYMAATVITWCYIFMVRLNYRISKRQLLIMMATGIVYIGVAIFINMSYFYLPGALTTIIVFLYVSIVVLLELLIGREKPKPIKIFCVALSLAGLILVVWDPSGAGELSLTGILFALGAGICYAVYATSLGGTLTKNMDSIVVIGYVLLLPTLFYFIRCFYSGQPLLPVTESQIFYISFLAVFSTFLGGVWFCKAVKIIGSGNAAVINTMEPVIAYFSGMILMGDVLNKSAILGGIIIITAIVILNIAVGSNEKIHLER